MLPIQPLKSVCTLVLVAIAVFFQAGCSSHGVVKVVEFQGGIIDGTVYGKPIYNNHQLGSLVPVFTVYSVDAGRSDRLFIRSGTEGELVDISNFRFWNSTILSIWEDCGDWDSELEHTDYWVSQISPRYLLYETKYTATRRFIFDTTECRSIAELPQGRGGWCRVAGTGVISCQIGENRYSQLSYHDYETTNKTPLFDSENSLKVLCAWENSLGLFLYYSQTEGIRSTRAARKFVFDTATNSHREMDKDQIVMPIGNRLLARSETGYGVGEYNEGEVVYSWHKERPVWSLRAAYLENGGVLAVVEFRHNNPIRVLVLYDSTSGKELGSVVLDYPSDLAPIFFDSKGFLHIHDTKKTRDNVYWVGGLN